MVHGMHLPWVACSNDLERAFVTLWSKFKIHTEDTHRSTFLPFDLKSPSKQCQEMKWRRKSHQFEGDELMCSKTSCRSKPLFCSCCTDIDFNQNFPKVPFKSSKENHSNYINSVSQCIDYKSLVRVSLLDLFFFIVKTIYLTFSSMTSVWTFLLSVVWKHCCKFGH